MKNQNHPKHKLALAAVQNTRNRQAENDLNNKAAADGELSTKTVKAVTQNKDDEKTSREKLRGSSCRGDQHSEARFGDQRNRATAETGNRKQRLNETLCMTRLEPETGENSMRRSNCNTFLKMVTGKPFGITKIGSKIMSIITVEGHEVTRNLSESSDQTIMHIDVYADYLSAISPKTPSRTLRAMLPHRQQIHGSLCFT